MARNWTELEDNNKHRNPCKTVFSQRLSWVACRRITGRGVNNFSCTDLVHSRSKLTGLVWLAAFVNNRAVLRDLCVVMANAQVEECRQQRRYRTYWTRGVVMVSFFFQPDEAWRPIRAPASAARNLLSERQYIGTKRFNPCVDSGIFEIICKWYISPSLPYETCIFPRLQRETCELTEV
jgi:hypothetical protein